MLDAKRHEKNRKKHINMGKTDSPQIFHSTKRITRGPRVDPKKLKEAKKASFIDRALARLIDSMILLGPNFLASILVPFVGGIIISALYFIHFYVKSGQTIGQKLVGVKVVSAKGYPITYEQAITRYAGAMLSTVILFIGFFMYFSSPQRQTLHDRIANTYVITLEGQPVNAIDGKE